jgi:hypothetical protein
MISSRFPTGCSVTSRRKGNGVVRNVSCCVNRSQRARKRPTTTKQYCFMHITRPLDIARGLISSCLAFTQAAMETEPASQEEGAVVVATADKPFRHTKPEAVVSKLYSYQLESLTWMTVPAPPPKLRAHARQMRHTCLRLTRPTAGDRRPCEPWSVLGGGPSHRLPRKHRIPRNTPPPQTCTQSLFLGCA